MEKSHSHEDTFDADSIRAYFKAIGEIAAKRGKQYEIAVFGGSALALCFDWRESTHDVDYMLVNGADQELSAIANEAAKSIGRPIDGLRSDVTIFASDYAELLPEGDYPAHGNGGLRVLVASPEYLLAMKVLSMRSSLETQDCWDVWNLLDTVDSDPKKALTKVNGIVSVFYPDKEIPVRNMRILEDIVAEKSAKKTYRRDIGW